MRITPCRAARDSPDMIAIGAASSSGHGVATTSTATARTGSAEISPRQPGRSIRVSGTKATANRSATRTNGAVSAWACSTRRTTPAYVDSAAVSVATCRTADPPLTTPLRMSSPGRRSTGIASPDSADSSNTPASSSRPSTGTSSPAPTSSRSPTATCSTGISTTPSAPSRRATRGAPAASRLSSRRARADARASSTPPVNSITAITAPASGSPTSSAPTSASQAITSTDGCRRRNATAIVIDEYAKPSTVAHTHKTLAASASPATAAPSPATSSSSTSRNRATSRAAHSRTHRDCPVGRELMIMSDTALTCPPVTVSAPPASAKSRKPYRNRARPGACDLTPLNRLRSRPAHTCGVRGSVPQHRCCATWSTGGAFQPARRRRDNPAVGLLAPTVSVATVIHRRR